MNARLVAVAVIFVVLVGSVGAYVPAYAESDRKCSFSTRDTIMELRADCTTDATILIPDGFTLDGAGHTITAVDPHHGHFLGAVVANAGTRANVRNLRITTSNLADFCDEKTPETDFRLRGIQFKGASGEITHNTVTDINQGAKSSCREGADIEVRNEPIDGSHPNTQTVEVSDNIVMNYQMVGIVAVGDVSVKIHHNIVTPSAAKANVPVSGIQLSYHAMGEISGNVVTGNWYQPVTPGDGKAIGQQPLVAAGILLYNIEMSNVKVFNNELTDNQINILVTTSASLGYRP